MKRILLLTMLGLATVSNLLAATPHGSIWNIGQILLNNGTEIQGEISYNWKAEIVQLRQNGTIKAYSAHQINQFAYFDAASNALRQFSAVNYPVRKNLERPVFLEEFAVGTFTVYRRLRRVREPFQIGTSTLHNQEEVLTANYDNFVYYVYTNGTFFNMNKFNRDLWPQMNQEFGPELKRYAEIRQLDTDNTATRLMLINRYNYLKAEADLQKQEVGD